MYSNYLCLEAILLVFLTHVGWYDHKHILWQCSRDKSKIVRNIIQKKFIPILERYRVPMPMDCPFHPQRDFLWWPDIEDEYELDDELSFQWSCPFCGSSFLCAEQLAIHWDETHRHQFTHAEDSVCLSDYCDIMRCDVIIANKRKRRNRLRSLALSKNKTVLNLETNCDPKHMKYLENRCESVVRQCTQGLISNISSKDYRDIEFELIASVCSYLTCDRYLDDYSNEKHNVSLSLCMAIGIVMIGGFCLCYYIVWMLFDSGYKSRAELMSRESVNEDNISNLSIGYNRLEEYKQLKQSISESESISGTTTASASAPVIGGGNRPKIMITSPSTHRLIRSQAIHYYHPYHPNHNRHQQHPHHHNQQYANIDEDSWESCEDVPIQAIQQPETRPTQAYPSTSSTAATTATAAIHQRPESVSRASSHTTTQSNQSIPYNR